ncbi:hypothetical protein [Rhodanobacter sp. C03]|uniref:hypothetical protein n=1 Tax=Rhodanobacter sp. C03 TaxID=1945858 RepID=UPI0020C43217|nr:hypothetical protein [Rhodanobacter sp. C03]
MHLKIGFGFGDFLQTARQPKMKELDVSLLRMPSANWVEPGHTKLESTVRYLGIEVEDALEIAEQTEV